MKQIGHVDGAMTEQAWRTHSLGMLSPHALFIPNPGERENIDADQWTLAGWVNPDKDGGTIYAHHRDASEGGDARPAYVRRPDPDRVETVMLTPGKLDPMDVRRSEFDASLERINALENILRPDLVKRGVLSEGAAAKPWKGVDVTEPSDLSMHAFQISTDDLIKEALEFCDSEVGYQRANVYIRELIGRLHSALRPKPAPTVQAEPPMSFYDHAFIHAAINHRHYYGDKGITEKLIEDAHAIAAKLTRNRAVPA